MQTKGFYLKDTGAGNILDSGGLDILSYQQRVQSDFNFRLNTIGAADTGTKFNELFTGIGNNTAIDAGDEITISGSDANGNNVSGTFSIGAVSDIQDLLDEVKTVYESQGATVEVDLNTSGEIIITDTSGGVSEMTFHMEFADINVSGSELQLSSVGSEGVQQNVFNNVLAEGKKAFFAVNGFIGNSETSLASFSLKSIANI